jgi:hypothetical protein
MRAVVYQCRSPNCAQETSPIMVSGILSLLLLPFASSHVIIVAIRHHD